MNGRPDGPSPALHAAQRRLEELKRSFQALAVNHERLAVSDEPLAVSCQPSAVSSLPSRDSDLPLVADHHLPTTNSHPSSFPLHRSRASDPPLSTDYRSLTTRLYPDIALGMLGRGMAASGRIWLLLRYLDEDGRGWLYTDQVQQKLCAKESDLRVCGRRQLRNLLRQGQGVFWQQDKERLWLRSAGRVAATLGVERLRGRPVALPLPVLLGGIGQVRAHFYASFHSGRTGGEKDQAGDPINRATLEKITHVPARTQRLYEERSGVQSQANMAVGERLNQKNLQERAWRHGRAVFPFVDNVGKHGPAGGRYVAWRLPNSYQGPHALSPKGRLKKINRQIDLVHSRAQGNSLYRVSTRHTVERLFHTSGQEAGRAYNRDQSRDIYYPSGRPRAGRRLWRVLPARCRLAEIAGLHRGRKEVAGIPEG